MRPVLVTTEHRGVFFGYVEDESTAPEKILLTQARMCVSWSGSIKGVLGLAVTGPNKDCRIGPPTPDATLWKLTGIFSCTEEATQAWEKAPWIS